MTTTTSDLPGYYYDPMAAKMAVAFFGLLHHTKGEWAGQPFTLQSWQKNEIIKPLFGWKRDDGTRRFKRGYIEIARKAGKSVLSSGIALYLLLADNEPGAEVYSAAADRAQAGIVFSQAKQMVEASPHLQKLCKVYKNAIEVPSTGSVYRVLSADVATKHGLNAHGIIFDELHAQPNRDLWDVLTTSVGARRQPVIIAITTAGYDRNSICWEQHEYARQVRDGIIPDPTFLPLIYAADDGDDWTDSAVWRKANPGMGVTIKEEYLAQECERAKSTPAYQNSFRRLHLNQWVSQESRWLNMLDWDRCNTPLPDLTGRPCYAGLDLSSTTDLSALVLAFPPQQEGEPIWLLPTIWIPQDNMLERSRKDRVPYDVWARDGYVQPTSGNVVDYDVIFNSIMALAEKYKIKEIAYDDWNATQIVVRLGNAGLTMVETRQGYKTMSPPTKELLRLVMANQIGHGGHPVMRWTADNVVVTTDPAGNIKPDKGANKHRSRIDPIVAGIMAIDRLTRNAEVKPKRSIYETRDLLVLG